MHKLCAKGFWVSLIHRRTSKFPALMERVICCFVSQPVEKHTLPVFFGELTHEGCPIRMEHNKPKVSSLLNQQQKSLLMESLQLFLVENVSKYCLLFSLPSGNLFVLAWNLSCLTILIISCNSIKTFKDRARGCCYIFKVTFQNNKNNHKVFQNHTK